MGFLFFNSRKNEILLRKAFLTFMSCEILLIFSSSVFRFHIELFDPFELICMQIDWFRSNLMLLHVDTELSQHHLLKMLFSPVYVFGIFVNYQVVVVMCSNV